MAATSLPGPPQGRLFQAHHIEHRQWFTHTFDFQQAQRAHLDAIGGGLIRRQIDQNLAALRALLQSPGQIATCGQIQGETTTLTATVI